MNIKTFLVTVAASVAAGLALDYWRERRGEN